MCILAHFALLCKDTQAQQTEGSKLQTHMERYQHLFNLVVEWYQRQDGPLMVIFVLHSVECYGLEGCVCGGTRARQDFARAVQRFNGTQIVVRRS